MWSRIKGLPLLAFVTTLLVIAAGIFSLAYPDSTSMLFGTLTPKTETVMADPNADIGPQRPLEQPPSPIKALYLTGWSAGTPATVAKALAILNKTELNAVVIDIKDYTGMVSYKPEAAPVLQYGAFEKRIKKINALIKEFHDANVYVIGRIAVFQDPQLVKARPEFALQSIKKGAPWADYKGIHWLDAAAPAVWDYNIAIAKDALQRGFDEVNFDYIRFPTDGDLADISFPFYDKTKETRRQVLQRFFKHLRDELPYAKISVDIFGETTVNARETGIGQYLVDPFPYVDAVAPMIYPSHFANGTIGFDNPAAHPYEIIRYAMDSGFARVQAFEKTLLTRAARATSTEPLTPPSFAQFRPWIQDFNLGANYDANKVSAQIRALNDAAKKAAGCGAIASSTPSGPCADDQIGWMLWSAGNADNTVAAFLPQTH